MVVPIPDILKYHGLNSSKWSSDVFFHMLQTSIKKKKGQVPKHTIFPNDHNIDATTVAFSRHTVNSTSKLPTSKALFKNYIHDINIK